MLRLEQWQRFFIWNNYHFQSCVERRLACHRATVECQTQAVKLSSRHEIDWNPVFLFSFKCHCKRDQDFVKQPWHCWPLYQEFALYKSIYRSHVHYSRHCCHVKPRRSRSSLTLWVTIETCFMRKKLEWALVNDELCFHWILNNRWKYEGKA